MGGGGGGGGLLSGVRTVTRDSARPNFGQLGAVPSSFGQFKTDFIGIKHWRLTVLPLAFSTRAQEISMDCLFVQQMQFTFYHPLPPILVFI